MHLHASTQMTVTGRRMKFLEEQGASRVVTARELSLRKSGGCMRQVLSRLNLLSMELYVTVIRDSA